MLDIREKTTFTFWIYRLDLVRDMTELRSNAFFAEHLKAEPFEFPVVPKLKKPFLAYKTEVFRQLALLTCKRCAPPDDYWFLLSLKLVYQAI